MTNEIEVEVSKLEKDETSETQFEFQLDNINQSYKIGYTGNLHLPM